MFSAGMGEERRLCVRARRRATTQLPRAECRGPPFDSSDSKVLHEFWGLVGCEAWEAILAIVVWEWVMQVKARDLWFLLGERARGEVHADPRVAVRSPGLSQLPAYATRRWGNNLVAACMRVVMVVKDVMFCFFCFSTAGGI